MPITSMPFAWQGILLLVAGSLLRALYIINNKHNLRGLSSRFVIVVNMLGTSALLFAVMLTLARPTITDWLSWPSGILWPLLATAILNIAVQYGELRALEIEDASLVTPMTAAAPVLSLLTGFIILRELPTIAGWFGVVLLSIGSYVLNASKPSADGTLTAAPASETKRHLHTAANLLLPWKNLARSRGVRLAFWSSVVASVSINFDKIVAVKTNALFLPAVVFGFVGLAMIPALRNEHLPRSLNRRQMVSLAATPFLFAVVAVLFVASFSYGLASNSSALRRLTILFVALLAGPLLKERGHPERVWGGAIMTAGALLLAF
ncbi:hypothetical protein A3F28_00180 [Candidatus Uhrbacteria bacterium RIFCSPHIGHO2_12_FULL_57_11]|uniref:EamA domain-containing protein n=2 Tax=Candidatus Uhriibacteriota TaxID=1752732 RepID=A0A1F7UNH5_9BACT|nr:MAG: hypothetical protein A3D72_01030 [Candidatus Uhrbacteria bacterium RIFCSPHIGHO2_02_FULL_57_19]OGL79841.1 MAG: hypothetical protein A3F28_00180 [Candidatus Uhrbacteria bacterium RIFCSPHIGHO2_12_FULL_57_11]